MRLDRLLDPWEAVGIKRPAVPPPPVGDPSALSDDELLARLVPLAVDVWNMAPRDLVFDRQSLLNRILYAMFVKARQYDPARGKDLNGVLVNCTRHLWQQEAADARLFGPTKHEGVSKHGISTRLYSTHDLNEEKGLFLAARPHRPDEEAAREFELDDRELDELLGQITLSEARKYSAELVRLVAKRCLVDGLSFAEAGEEIGLSRDTVGSLLAVARRTLISDPVARELVGLPPAKAGLDAAEAARYAAAATGQPFTTKRLNHARTTGRIPATRDGHLWRYEPADLDAYLKTLLPPPPAAPRPPPDPLTVLGEKEAATYVARATCKPFTRTMLRWRRETGLLAATRSGSVWRYKTADLDAFIAAAKGKHLLRSELPGLGMADAARYIARATGRPFTMKALVRYRQKGRVEAVRVGQYWRFETAALDAFAADLARRPVRAGSDPGKKTVAA